MFKLRITTNKAVAFYDFRFIVAAVFFFSIVGYSYSLKLQFMKLPLKQSHLGQ